MCERLGAHEVHRWLLVSSGRSQQKREALTRTPKPIVTVVVGLAFALGTVVSAQATLKQNVVAKAKVWQHQKCGEGRT
jgi:hypothetical protein